MKNISLSSEQVELIEALLLNAISNGNTVNPASFKPTPEQYKGCFTIMAKFEK